MPGPTVLRGVHHPGRRDHLFDEFGVPGCLYHSVMIDGPQPTVLLSALVDPLDGRGPLADER
jgi:hypothetical protein